MLWCLDVILVNCIVQLKINLIYFGKCFLTGEQLNILPMARSNVAQCRSRLKSLSYHTLSSF